MAYNISPNSVLASAGTAVSYTSGTSSWASSFSNSNGKALLTVPKDGDRVVVSESASLEVNGKLLFNGFDLEERLSTIEKVLGIPTRDIKMEKKYPRLYELHQQYMLELEKYHTWDRIKGNEE